MIKRGDSTILILFSKEKKGGFQLLKIKTTLLGQSGPYVNFVF
jgi:hypothetical protein